jgi:hypothetical protein
VREIAGFTDFFQKNKDQIRDQFFSAFFELFIFFFGIVVVIFAHNLFMLVFSIILMLGAGTFIFYASAKPDRDLRSAKSLRKREIEVNLPLGGAFNLCRQYIDRLPSKTIISSNPDAGLIEVVTPKKLFPCPCAVQYILKFELEYIGVSKTDIKYSSRYAPPSSLVTETSREGRNMEKLREIGSFFEKYRVSHKEK